MKREFVMLAKTYSSATSRVNGWFQSEKIDGMRAFWDGGCSRGLPKRLVPWANLDKDERYRKEQIATGLWTRLGNVIHAPAWFLDALPARQFLDGELYAPSLMHKNGHRQFVNSTVKDLNPFDANWRMIRYGAFEMPPVDIILADGDIDTTNFKRKLRGCVEWTQGRPEPVRPFIEPRLLPFRSVVHRIMAFENEIVVPLRQEELPYNTSLTAQHLEADLINISSQGGEGLMVRDGNSYYACQRAGSLLKIKKLDDAEGVVAGYITGEETELGSKLRGRLGSLILQLGTEFKGTRVKIKGFNNDENHLNDETWAYQHPGQETDPNQVWALSFPVGSRVSFKYRGTSSNGVPQEVRFWRKYQEGV